MTDWRYRRAVRVLWDGGVIVYPTESTYGIGCDPWHGSGVARVRAIKRRPAHKPFILIAADPGQLEPFVDIEAHGFRRFADRYWPGPVTLIAPARAEVPGWLTNTDGTLATRVTDHPVARDLCASFRGALISTSANRHGRTPTRDALRTRARFGTEVDYYVAGRTGGLDTPTRIIDTRDGRIVRL